MLALRTWRCFGVRYLARYSCAAASKAKAGEEDRVVAGEGDVGEHLLHLSRADRAVQRPEADRDAAWLRRLQVLTLGVHLPAVGGRRERRELEMATARQPDAVDAQQVDQLADAADRALAGSMAHVIRPIAALERTGVVLADAVAIGRLDAEARDLLDAERTGHAGLAPVDLRLVVQRLGLRRLVLRDAAQGHVRHGLVDETAVDAAVRIGQVVPVVAGGHEALACERERDPAGVAGDPAPSPLLGDVRRRPRPARRIEHEVTRIGGH
jgi:hypothetical protein